MKSNRLFVVLFLLLLLGLGSGYYLFHDLPSLDSLPQRLNTPSLRIEDRYGRLLYEALDEDGGRHTVVPLDQIPPACRQAAIATEDRRFYEHAGVDVTGIIRAAWINLRGGDISAGGSTITQQVARTLLMDSGERVERSLRRKLREAVLAWQLTRRFSKDEVLALYLNQTYYGGMAYGIRAAAETFFGRPVEEMDTAQCALLAGLPQAPAAYNPFTDPQAARKRQAVVLGLMEQAGYLTAEQRSLAEREPLVFAETPYPIQAPHFAMLVRAELDRLFTPEDLYRYGGLTARTTLDLDWQYKAEAAVAHHLADLQHSEDGLGHNVNNAALVAIDPHTGEVLALVGSPDYFDGEHGGAINMALAPRQPGSALKPLVYAAALRPDANNGGWTAATLLLDVRTAFQTNEGAAYTPANYDLLEHGPVLVRDALASSLNIPAVLTLEHVGLEDFFVFARSLGITTFGDPQRYDLSLSLGGGEVRLLELTTAYGAFANSGYRVHPQTLLEVRDAAGNIVYTPPTLPEVRVLDERIAWLISDILSDNDARRLGFGPNTLLRLERPAAVKTGTTSNFHDNWTIGYTPDLVVGVWSGNTSYESMRAVNGLSGAGPIWHQFIRSVLSGRPAQPFNRPPGLVQVEVCALSGKLPSDACPYRRLEWFIEGTQPAEKDTFYRQVFIDASTGRLASPQTPVEQRRSELALDLPPQAFAWARRQGLQLFVDLQPDAALVNEEEKTSDLPLDKAGPTDGTENGITASIRLISPANGASYRLAPGLDSSIQSIPLEVSCPQGMRRVSIWLDGEQLASFDTAPYRMWWPLALGEHHLWAEAILPDGSALRSPVVTFTVSAG